MTKRQMYIKLVVSSLIRRKARMIVALLAVAIGATIMSGLVTIYYDIPRQLGKEFRSYGANFVVLPAGNEKITDTEFNEIKNEMSTQKVVGMAPYRYETTKINQVPGQLSRRPLPGQGSLPGTRPTWPASLTP